MKVLVISGAGLHGAFQVGVLKVMFESGYKPDLIIGTSVGAINGVALSHVGVEPLVRIWGKIKTINSIFKRNWSFPICANGLYTGQPLLQLMTEEIQGTAPTIPYLVVSCDMEIGQSAFFERQPDGTMRSTLDGTVLSFEDCMAGTFAIPGVVSLVNNRWADGGITDVAPVAEAIRRGADEVLVVLGYNQGVERWNTPKPSILSVISRVADIATGRMLQFDVNDYNGASAVVEVIQAPLDLPIGMLQVKQENIQKAIAIGIQAAEEYLKKPTGG